MVAPEWWCIRDKCLLASNFIILILWIDHYSPSRQTSRRQYHPKHRKLWLKPCLKPIIYGLAPTLAAPIPWYTKRFTPRTRGQAQFEGGPGGEVSDSSTSSRMKAARAARRGSWWMMVWWWGDQGGQLVIKVVSWWSIMVGGGEWLVGKLLIKHG